MGFLGWSGHTKEGFIKCSEFIQCAIILDLDENIVHRCIEIKRMSKIKLPDAIIAATAIEKGLILVTRNQDDFKELSELKMLNPYL